MIETSALRRPLAAILSSAALAALALTAGPAMGQGASAPAAPPAAPPVHPAPSEIVAAAPATDWVAIPASDLLVMTLAPDARGRERRIIIQLMPAPFSQGWVGNIRTLAAAHWWDGLAVTRVQDNYVAQWGDPDGEDPAKARALPAGLAMVDEGAYVADSLRTLAQTALNDPANEAAVTLWQRQAALCGFDPSRLPERPCSALQSMAGHSQRSYAEWEFHFHGWPVATDYLNQWPIHCYGMVGVGRGMSPDTGSGAELYTVIGHAPRHLDRNIALVGRVVEGIEHLSSLPRGTGPLGFYETPEERTAITSIRLASDLPAAEQPRMEYLSTESTSFARYAEARANRRDPFFIVPAGGADICNIPVPVRRVRAGG